MFSIISSTSSPFSMFNYNLQSAKFCVYIHPVKTLLTCAHCGLCLRFHELAPVVCAVFLLAREDWGLCHCCVVSRLLWQSHAKPQAQDRQAGDVTERVWRTIHRTRYFCCQMHSSTNALQVIYRPVVKKPVIFISLKALFRGSILHMLHWKLWSSLLINSSLYEWIWSVISYWDYLHVNMTHVLAPKSHVFP